MDQFSVHEQVLYMDELDATDGMDLQVGWGIVLIYFLLSHRNLFMRGFICNV